MYIASLRYKFQSGNDSIKKNKNTGAMSWKMISEFCETVDKIKDSAGSWKVSVKCRMYIYLLYIEYRFYWFYCCACNFWYPKTNDFRSEIKKKAFKINSLIFNLIWWKKRILVIFNRQTESKKLFSFGQGQYNCKDMQTQVRWS